MFVLLKKITPLNWYLEDIQKLEKKPVTKSRLKKVVFYGSSSFTRWETLEKATSDFNFVNLGFGGSTLAACTWFYDRVVPRQKPDAVFIYAGDNDLGDGRNPEEVVIFYKQLITQIRETFTKIPVCFISIKPSPARATLKGSIEYTNKCILEITATTNNNLHYIDVYSKMLDEKGGMKNELYVEDRLHLSVKGYELWQEEILKKCHQFFIL